MQYHHYLFMDLSRILSLVSKWCQKAEMNCELLNPLIGHQIDLHCPYTVYPYKKLKRFRLNQGCMEPWLRFIHARGAHILLPTIHKARLQYFLLATSLRPSQ